MKFHHHHHQRRTTQWLMTSPVDLQHHIWLLVLDGHLTKAPFASRDPPNVLDIGTGTGIWAKQFARHHPGSTVIGTDLSLIQTQDNLPPNVSFVREDSEELWVFDHLFDYIHWRASMSDPSRTPSSWPC